MFKVLAILLFVTIGFSGFTYAQTKTITNADLEKFRSQRLVAEKELRENYESMGFPSPEELERQNEESRFERARWAENYRSAQLEQQRIDSESRPSQVFYFIPQTRQPYRTYYRNGYAPAYYYGSGYNYRRNRTRKPGPGYITNPLIREAWLRQSAPMRNTYRGNFRNFNPVIRTNRRN